MLTTVAVQVAVIGSGAEWEAAAEEVGRLLAERGCTVVTGGLGEVMAAAHRGAKEAGGTTIAILPGEEHASDYEIGAFDAAIRFPPERDFREEITLPIRIIHREGFDRPVDACEVRCLQEMEKKLEALGASKGKWRPPGHGPAGSEKSAN